MPIIIHLFSFLNKKNLETTILLQGLITGDERIELPLKVLETSVIPFDQSTIFKYYIKYNKQCKCRKHTARIRLHYQIQRNESIEIPVFAIQYSKYA